MIVGLIDIHTESKVSFVGPKWIQNIMFRTMFVNSLSINVVSVMQYKTKLAIMTSL